MKKTLSVILAVIMMFAVVPMASFAADVQANEIKEIVVDFIYPVIGDKAYTDSFLESDGVEVVDAKWFEESSDAFIGEDSQFKAGKYFIQVTFKAADGNVLADRVSVVINGKNAIDVTDNGDGTVTASGLFEIEESGEETHQFSFLRFFEAVKTILLAIVRFFGEMIGLN